MSDTTSKDDERVYIDTHNSHTSEEYIQAQKIYKPVIVTMKALGYALSLDGKTFYKTGYELEPNSTTTFTMRQAYEVHRAFKQYGIQERIDELNSLQNQKEIVTDYKERFNFDAVNTAYIVQRKAELTALKDKEAQGSN